MTIDELKAAPIEVVLEEILIENEYVPRDVLALRIVSVLDALGWIIVPKLSMAGFSDENIRELRSLKR